MLLPSLLDKNMSHIELKEDDLRTAKNRKEFMDGFKDGFKCSVIVVGFVFATKEAGADDSVYCDENYMDLDLPEQNRILARETCLATRAAKEAAARLAAQPNKLTQTLNILGGVGSFAYQNSNFILGFACSGLVITTAVIVYPETSKKLNKICQKFSISKKITDQELAERYIDGIFDS